MRRPIEASPCPLSGAVEQIGDAWMLMILWSSYEGVTRFDDYQRRLGVARNILSNRLRRLVDQGILEKRPVRDGARRLRQNGGRHSRRQPRSAGRPCASRLPPVTMRRNDG